MESSWRCESLLVLPANMFSGLNLQLAVGLIENENNSFEEWITVNIIKVTVEKASNIYAYEEKSNKRGNSFLTLTSIDLSSGSFPVSTTKP